MNNDKTLYEILDLPKYGINDQGESITLERIQKNERAIRFQVDKEWNIGAQAKEERLAQVQKAYEVLSNPKLRKQYDKYLEGFIEGQNFLEQSKNVELITTS